MPTNKERREVVKELRYTATHSLNGYSFQRSIEGTVFGTLGDRTWRETLTRLADLIEPEPINGETSDGYHTFNELYHHRALLFSVIVRNYPEMCWKSKKHHAGDMYEGMFIVGINTPDGQASYHYDIEPYWDMFKCEELEFAPEWDGHTPAQAIERIGKLMRHEPETERTCRNTTRHRYYGFECSECKWSAYEPNDYGNDVRFDDFNYCPNCGSKVIRNAD